MPLNLIIEADGGSRGNPGTSGSGAVIIERHSGEILVEIAADNFALRYSNRQTLSQARKIFS